MSYRSLCTVLLWQVSSVLPAVHSCQLRGSIIFHSFTWVTIRLGFHGRVVFSVLLRHTLLNSHKHIINRFQPESTLNLLSAALSALEMNRSAKTVCTISCSLTVV